MSVRLSRAPVCASALVFGWALPFCSFGQQAVPPQVQPGAAERQLQRPPEPIPTAPGAVAPVAVPDRAPPGADTVFLTLKSLEVEGAHAVSSSELATIYHDDLGKQISLNRVYGIAGAMTALYRKHGFFLGSVVVPAQTIAEGHVKLVAVEGFLHEVTFEGYTGSRPGLFAKVREKLLADRPLRTSTLERQMLLLNDLPGIRAQAILSPAPNAAGAADLRIVLHRAAVGGTVGFNNRGSKLQGPNQTDASLALNSTFGLLEGTTLQYLGALPASELHLFALTHVERLTADGLDLTVSASHSKSQPELGVSFAQYNLETNTTQARLQLAYPLLRSRADSLGARLAVTYHDGSTDALGARLWTDKLAAVRAGLRWDNLDAWAGVNLVDVELAKGLNTLGASHFGSQDASRLDGHPDFTKATAYMARLQSLTGPFSLLVAISGQYATDRVLEPEEFAIGGEPFGRAYDASEIVGDSGVAGKAELRLTLESSSRLSTTFYGFADRGEVWRRLLPVETSLRPTEAASSAGGGVRFSWSPWVTGYVEAAKPLDHIVAARGNQDTRLFAGFELLLGP